MQTKIKLTKDAALLARLNEEVQELHYSLYPDIFKPFHQNNVTGFFEEVLKQPDSLAYTAYSEGSIAGYALLFIKKFEENPFQYERKFLVLDQILVLKPYRKQNIGKLLLEKAGETAKENGITRIQLNHWTLNTGARSFFTKMGFQYCNENMFMDI